MTMLMLISHLPRGRRGRSKSLRKVAQVQYIPMVHGGWHGMAWHLIEVDYSIWKAVAADPKAPVAATSLPS
jgi:hypothetical protein